jgi:uncharacterized protein (DUF1800 family)
MDRRSFLQFLDKPKKSKITAQKLLDYTANKSISQSGLAPYTGPWTKIEATHLLKRTMYGATFADVNYMAALTMSNAVNEILNVNNFPLPAPPLKEYNPMNASTPDTSVLVGTTWVNDFNKDGNVNYLRRQSFKKWWIGNMINQDRSIREKMTMFWHNHFGTESDTIESGVHLYNLNELLRQNCLGNFKNMVKDVSKDAAMLIYLNGKYNTNTAPDENYARELMELFTLGKGPNSQYNQNDVQEAAKVLTGWRVSSTSYAVTFDPTKHDSGNKTFSSFFGNGSSYIINGVSGPTGGALELNDLITMIFSKDEVAKFICRKLYRFFVYYKIDATIEANIITPLAQIFVNNNYNILPVMETLLKSEHFYDINTIGAVIKPGIDYVVGMLREFKVVFPTASDYDSNYKHFEKYFSKSKEFGQELAEPPNVAGWPAYYQAPLYHEIWVNTSTYPARVKYGETMIGNGYTYNNITTKIDVIEFAKLSSNPADPNQLIADILGVIYSIAVDPADITTIKVQTLLSNQAGDIYWTNAWNDYIGAPTNASFISIVKTRLTSMLEAFILREEYHLS